MNEYARSILTTFGERKFIKRPGRKDERELEKSVEKVNKTLEAIPLLTEISDVTCLNNLSGIRFRNNCHDHNCRPREAYQ